MSTVINSQTTVNTGIPMYSNHIIGAGQAFTVEGDFFLDKMSFYLQRYGTLTGNVVAKLYNVDGIPEFGENGAIPTGSALTTSSNVVANNITTQNIATATPTEFVFDSTYFLKDGNSYAFVFEYADSTDSNNYLIFGSNNTATPRENENILLEFYGHDYYVDGWYPYVPMGSDDMAYIVYGIEFGPVVGQKYALPPFRRVT
jgi:hypothetical protein